jgi:hypothetical protein
VPNNSNRRDDARRANKDRRARLDEMRRQQRAVERRKNFITFGSAIVVALALVGTAVGLAFQKSQENDAKKHRVENQLKAEKKEGHQSKPTKAETKNGCLGVHTDPLSPPAKHLPNPIDYLKEKFGDTGDGTPPIPPSGGPHNAVSLGDKVRFYPLEQKPRPERAVHNLEHGYVVAWYDSKVPADQVQVLKDMANDASMERLLVVGWWQGDLPSGKHVVLTSWSKTDRCATVSTDVTRDFYTVHVNAPQAPERFSPAITGADQVPAGTLPQSSPAPMTSGSPQPTASSTKK